MDSPCKAPDGGCTDSLTRRVSSYYIVLPVTGYLLTLKNRGGVRGISELVILTEIERQVGMGIRIQELFDLVIGTSTGSYGP